MVNAGQDGGRSIVVLGQTPPYLAPHSHEALYEIDLGVLKSESTVMEEHGHQQRFAARKGTHSGER